LVRAAKEGRQSLFVTVTVKEGKMDEYNEVRRGPPRARVTIRSDADILPS
jgi:hypothetical protein